ncbi:hypothetical protein [Nakamurella leprariae]|uniref:Uncharacterized protein n=1 Tax=Nakamurella leprariae TaxID=2803911 RepID=A0A939BV58_9ACTN|nr:hypothetical protein [Nakamurella leprariae]MBM9466208.1 hypothetical protein [Nakamurella leprariae]
MNESTDGAGSAAQAAGPARRRSWGGLTDGFRGGPDDLDTIAAHALTTFVRTHGDGCVAVVQPLGRPGARVVVVAPDGRWGDAVVSTQQVGEQLCERTGITVQQWDRELSARLTPTPADRRRMAGTGR